MWVGTASGGLAVYREGGIIHDCGVKGDVNSDGSINVLDVVTAINIILHDGEHDACVIWRSDCSGDGEVDVADVLNIVNAITGLGTCWP